METLARVQYEGDPRAHYHRPQPRMGSLQLHVRKSRPCRGRFCSSHLHVKSALQRQLKAEQDVPVGPWTSLERQYHLLVIPMTSFTIEQPIDERTGHRSSRPIIESELINRRIRPLAWQINSQASAIGVNAAPAPPAGRSSRLNAPKTTKACLSAARAGKSRHARFRRPAAVPGFVISHQPPSPPECTGLPLASPAACR